MSETDWLSEQESFDLLRQMFPGGLESADVLSVLCPQGWEGSSLKLLFTGEAHGEQQDTDNCRLGYLVGLCLWDILSDNHDLIFPNGQVAHLGSFRATAGIISDFFAGESGDGDKWGEGYLDFYMGTWSVKNRDALKPIYRYIFSRLRERGIDWKYSFPRLCVIRFDKPEGETKADFENYDPSASFAAEKKEREEEEESARLEEQLEKLYRESIEQARSEPPPATVRAYFEVFGKWPSGWPPWE